MKSLFKICLAAALLLPAVCAFAQGNVTANIYPVTNSTTLGLTNLVLLAPGAVSNVTSDPFPLFRDRGYNSVMTVTNTSAATLTEYWDYSNDKTNWTSDHPVANTITVATGVLKRGFALVPKTTVDNWTWGRLSAISNSSATAITLLTGSTNTYVAIQP